jgi:SSS family solute:Na+ symporter
LGAGVLVGGVLIATQFDSILQQLKLWWELNVMVAASFWLGIKWRRANRTGAWCSILVTAIFFFLLPLLLPVLSPDLRTSPRLLKQTEQRTLVRKYKAHELDVVERNEAIEAWERLHSRSQTDTPKPKSIRTGQMIEKTYQHPSRAIFWTKGIKTDVSGQLSGQGMLSLELVLADKLGVNLGRNPYALNETIRILIRTTVPFLILILVSLMTKQDDRRLLDRFFVKMKTPVLIDADDDARELARSYANPRRFDSKKLFPRSGWEFDKWNRTDTVGFIISCLVAGAVLVLLMSITQIGR